MIFKSDGWNIILAGFWNRAIFTPEWVGRVLFDSSEVEVLLTVLPHLPIVYQNDKVAVEVSNARLAFRPIELDDNCLTAAEKMAHKVLSMLRDTPLIAVGVNFAFTEDNPDDDLLRVFNFRDNGKLTDEDWSLHERKVVRQLRKGNDTMNLTLMLSGGVVTAEFNYHSEISDNAKAIEAVEKRVIRLRDSALDLLKRVYGLESTGD